MNAYRSSRQLVWSQPALGDTDTPKRRQQAEDGSERLFDAMWRAFQRNADKHGIRPRPDLRLGRDEVSAMLLMNCRERP